MNFLEILELSVLFVLFLLGTQIFPLIVGYYFGLSKFEDAELVERLNRLKDKMGFPKAILRVVGERKPLSPNGWAFGLVKPTIFLSRSLVLMLTPAEVEAVVAHELTHHKERHLVVQVVLILGYSFFSSTVEQFFLNRGTPELAVYAVSGALFFLFLALTVRPLSRVFEIRADRGAFRYGSQPQALETALRKIVFPSSKRKRKKKFKKRIKEIPLSIWKMFRWFVSNHPPLEERITIYRKNYSQSQLDQIEAD